MKKRNRKERQVFTQSSQRKNSATFAISFATFAVKKIKYEN